MIFMKLFIVYDKKLKKQILNKYNYKQLTATQYKLFITDSEDSAFPVIHLLSKVNQKDFPPAVKKLHHNICSYLVRLC